MKRMLGAAGLMAVVLGLAAISSSAQDPQEPPDSIKSIMKALHAKDKGHLNQAKAALKASPVDWAAVEKAAQPIETLSKALPALEPPQGDQEDYVRQCQAYTTQATALLTAARAKDQAAARKAVDALGKSCMKCHEAHK